MQVITWPYAIEKQPQGCFSLFLTHVIHFIYSMARHLPRHTISPNQPTAGGVLLVDLGELLLAVDIGLVDTVYPAAAGVAAAIAAVTGAAAGAEGAADDLLPLGAGGVLNEQGLHEKRSSRFYRKGRTGRASRPSPPGLSAGHVDHILNEYAVAAGGVVEQDVGDRADDAAVLEDGAAAHG